MKKIVSILFIFAFAFVFMNKTNAQPFKVGFYTGYGMSSFENFNENAGYLPLGLQAYYSLDKMKFGSLNFGLDFNYAVVPYTFETTGRTPQGAAFKGDWKINQMIITSLIKVKFLKGTFQPFARLGAGLYTGGSTFEFDNASQQAGFPTETDIDIESGFGFNIGAGTDFYFSKKGASALFVEFVFHIVSRKSEGAAEANGANNWAVQLGYQLGFGK